MAPLGAALKKSARAILSGTVVSESNPPGCDFFKKPGVLQAAGDDDADRLSPAVGELTTISERAGEAMTLRRRASRIATRKNRA
jgi:hypothetical protein